MASFFLPCVLQITLQKRNLLCILFPAGNYWLAYPLCRCCLMQKNPRLPCLADSSRGRGEELSLSARQEELGRNKLIDQRLWRRPDMLYRLVVA